MAIEIRLPELGENIDSATVTGILVKVGDTVKANQPILEVDTEKASVDVPASFAGTIREIRVKEGDVVKTGQTVMTLEDTGKAAELPVAATPTKVQPIQTPMTEVIAQPRHAGAEVSAAPSLRRMARELGIDIHTVAGTGPEGRISEEDVRNQARSIILNASAAAVIARAAQLPDLSRWGEIERKAMSSTRRAIADHVHAAWSSIPHVTQFDTADITDLEEERKSLEKKTGSKLTITAIAIKVSATALKAFPQFNVSIDVERREIIARNYIHIGVAVDTEQGLLVPVIRDVDRKSILELSLELTQTAEKARNRTVSLEEMQGGTFTITNLGGIGGVGFTPIINSPEVAILGISRASLQPVFRDGKFRPRLILPMALSFDHRVVDGADGARFLRWVAEAFEQPLKLQVEG